MELQQQLQQQLLNFALTQEQWQFSHISLKKLHAPCAARPLLYLTRCRSLLHLLCAKLCSYKWFPDKVFKWMCPGSTPQQWIRCSFWSWWSCQASCSVPTGLSTWQYKLNVFRNCECSHRLLSLILYKARHFGGNAAWQRNSLITKKRNRGLIHVSYLRFLKS